MTTLLGGIVGAQFAPLMVEWGGALLGAALGGAACVSFAPAMSWWPSAKLWGMAFSFGAVSVWAAESVLHAIGAGALMKDEFRPFLAIAVGAHWRWIIAGIPEVVGDLWRRRPGGDK